MDKTEAKRLLDCCIPGIVKSKDAAKAAGNLRSSPSSDIQVKSLCRLWGGMGYVYNVSTTKRDIDIVVKRVSQPKQSRNQQSLGDKRKADSYVCEANFYKNLAPYLIESNGLKIPRPYFVETEPAITICMEKLTGFVRSVDREETFAVLDFLSTLHATTWGTRADEAVTKHGLQPLGTYWHLDTRPDEHTSMRNNGWHGRLKLAAKAIDERLKRDKMQCCVHGDAKDANMLFQKDDCNQLSVSMYDFQYCGKGPPSKDLAYFLCVAAYDNSFEYVQYYHQQLLKELDDDCDYRPTLEELNDSLMLAYCDWARFMCGWGFWRNSIDEKVISVLDRLDGGKQLGSEEAYDAAVRREYG